MLFGRLLALGVVAMLILAIQLIAQQDDPVLALAKLRKAGVLEAPGPIPTFSIGFRMVPA